MTDDEYILWEFQQAGWKPPANPQHEWNAFDKVPYGYEYVPPRWVWDSIPDHPPHEPVPCKRCGKESQPYCRYEFTRLGTPTKAGWAVGIGLFAYICPDHGQFINQAIERGHEHRAGRNGHRVSVS